MPDVIPSLVSVTRFLVIDASFLNIVIIFCSYNEFVFERTCQLKYQCMKPQSFSPYSGLAIACLVVLSVSEFHKTSMFTLEEKQRECLFWPLLSSRSKESPAVNVQLSAPKSDYTRSRRAMPWTSALFTALRILKGAQ